MQVISRALVVVTTALAVAACSIGETNYETVSQPIRKVSEVKTCTGAFAKPDLGALTACGDGKGHCFDAATTSIANLSACAGGTDVCIPDKVLTANGGRLKSCKFFVGDKPGACMSLLIPDLNAHKDEIKQDVCEADERCAPCIDPRDGTDTHICDLIGVYVDKCKGGPGAQEASCCHGQGVCLNAEAVPEGSRDKMSRDVCKSAKLCAPVAMVDGNPQHCSALALSGVCIDVCFAKMMGPSAPVMRGGCGPTSVCLPCVIGKGQGMPGCN